MEDFISPEDEEKIKKKGISLLRILKNVLIKAFQKIFNSFFGKRK